MTNSAISAIELGKAPLTEQNIRLICLTFDVNEEWLREGRGEMMDEEALLSDRERRLLDNFRRLTPRACKMLIEYAEKLVSDEQTLRGGDLLIEYTEKLVSDEKALRSGVEPDKK